jgi:hypothetical protein
MQLAGCSLAVAPFWRKTGFHFSARRFQVVGSRAVLAENRFPLFRRAL